MDRLEQIFEAICENATFNSFDLKLMAYKVKKLSTMMYATMSLLLQQVRAKTSCGLARRAIL